MNLLPQGVIEFSVASFDDPDSTDTSIFFIGGPIPPHVGKGVWWPLGCLCHSAAQGNPYCSLANRVAVVLWLGNHEVLIWAVCSCMNSASINKISIVVVKQVVCNVHASLFIYI